MSRRFEPTLVAAGFSIAVIVMAISAYRIYRCAEGRRALFAFSSPQRPRSAALALATRAFSLMRERLIKIRSQRDHPAPNYTERAVESETRRSN